MPENLEIIGANSFIFTAIREITIPKSVKSIGNYAFSGYRKDGNTNYLLEKVVLQEGLESIENAAFSDLPIKELVIPRSVKSIGDLAFSDCKNLSSVTFQQGQLNNIGSKCFDGTNLK